MPVHSWLNDFPYANGGILERAQKLAQRKPGDPHPFERFLAPYRQTAETVGMRFLDPLVFHGAHRAEAHEVHAHAHAFAERLLALAGEARASSVPALPDVAADVAADERRITTDH